MEMIKEQHQESYLRSMFAASRLSALLDSEISRLHGGEKKDMTQPESMRTCHKIFSSFLFTSLQTYEAPSLQSNRKIRQDEILLVYWSLLEEIGPRGRIIEMIQQ